MTYPSGIRHIIINVATPVEDGEIRLVQLLYRNDTEADCPTQKLIDWDATIVREDKDVLESTSPDAILDVQRRIEAHMPSDRPGLIMRKPSAGAAAQAQGEQEVTYRLLKGPCSMAIPEIPTSGTVWLRRAALPAGTLDDASSARLGMPREGYLHDADLKDREWCARGR